MKMSPEEIANNRRKKFLENVEAAKNEFIFEKVKETGTVDFPIGDNNDTLKGSLQQNLNLSFLNPHSGNRKGRVWSGTLPGSEPDDDFRRPGTITSIVS